LAYLNLLIEQLSIYIYGLEICDSRYAVFSIPLLFLALVHSNK